MFIPNPGESPEGVQKRFEDAQARLQGRGIDTRRFGWGNVPTPQAAPSQSPQPMARPGQAQSQQSPYATATPYGQQASRPPAFQAYTQNFDGTQSQMPDFQRRDAFISQINNQLGQMAQQSQQRPGARPPKLNFPQMWNQAGQMVQQGWQNPFAARAQGDMVPGAAGRPMGPGLQSISQRFPGAIF